QFARFVGGCLAVDAARVALAIMDAARLFGELRADIIAVGFDLLAQFDERRPELRRRDRRARLARAADARRHQRFLDLRLTAFRARNLARLQVSFISFAIPKTAFELMPRCAAQ